MADQTDIARQVRRLKLDAARRAVRETGSKTKAARRLKIGRRSIYRWLRPGKAARS